MKKKWLPGLPAVCLIACLFCYFQVQAASVSDLKDQQEAAQQEADELEKARQELEASLGDMNSQLYQLSGSIEELQVQIGQSEEELARLEQELSEAEEKEQRQYEDMKLRIQYLYENSSDLSWTALLESQSFADFLNRIQYISDITGYDRRLLADYQTTLENIADCRTQMEQHRQQLLASQEELGQQENTLLASIADTQQDLDETAGELAGKQQEADKLAEQIAAMEAYERQLEAQRAAEAAKRMEEIRRQEAESQSTAGNVVTPQGGEEELLAALIYCEAGGESYEAQLAVGSVVLNRVNSSYFSDTITGVIYEPRQFSPVASGKLALVLENGMTTDSCRNAAKEVLGGHITGSWLYFCVDNGTIDGTVIGKQVFY